VPYGRAGWLPLSSLNSLFRTSLSSQRRRKPTRYVDQGGHVTPIPRVPRRYSNVYISPHIYTLSISIDTNQSVKVRWLYTFQQ